MRLFPENTHAVTAMLSDKVYCPLCVAMSLLCSLPAFGVPAEGDWGKKPIFDSEGEITGVVDFDGDCMLLVDQSGRAIFFCVEAPEEETEGE